MHERSEIVLRRTLKQWQSRQQTDGYLTSILVFVSLVATLRFVFSPGTSSAVVTGLFLSALVMACSRLLNSAGKVVEIRSALYPGPGPEIIEVEVLATAEHRTEAAESPLHPSRHLLN